MIDNFFPKFLLYKGHVYLILSLYLGLGKLTAQSFAAGCASTCWYCYPFGGGRNTFNS